jgi:hypothetical protein
MIYFNIRKKSFYNIYLQEDLSKNNVFDQRKKQDSPCMRVLKLWVFQPQHTFDSTPAKYSLHLFISHNEVGNKNYKP